MKLHAIHPIFHPILSKPLLNILNELFAVTFCSAETYKGFREEESQRRPVAKGTMHE